MFALIHVSIALSSIAYTTFLFFRPVAQRFIAAYGLVAATLGSGVYLVISTHSNLLQSCMSGIAYLGIVSAGIYAARIKLAKERNNS